MITAVAPSGKGDRVSGGATISGKWSFASGVRFAEWGIVGVMLGGDQKSPTHHLCLVKKEQWQVHDNWEVMGLKGTGSADIEIENIFVKLENPIEIRIPFSIGFSNFTFFLQNSSRFTKSAQIGRRHCSQNVFQVFFF
mgnify:CR=1 FL=1